MDMKITVRELREIIREVAQEVKYDNVLEEGFLDTLKKTAATAAIGASLMFPSSASANVPSSGDTYSAQETPQEDQPFVIYDEDGKPHNFYLLTYVRVEGKRYAAMETDENELVYLFRVIITKEGEVIFKSIENEAEWEKVKTAVEEELESDDEDNP